MQNNNFIISLKVFIALSMVFGHCLIFGSLYWPENAKIVGDIGIFIFRSFSASVIGCLPAMATFVWILQSYGKGMGISEAKKVLFFLWVVEAFKSIFLTGKFISIFHFDVLVLIGLSLLVIELYWQNRKWVLITIFLLLFFTNPFFDYLRFKFMFRNFRIFYENQYAISCTLVLIATSLLGGIVFKFKKHSKVWVKTLYIIFILLFAIKAFYFDLKNPKLLYDFVNFPLGSLVGVYKSLHVWPFLVWLPFMIYGGFLGLYFSKYKTLKKDVLLILFHTFYLIFYYQEVFPQSFYHKMLGNGLGNESVFFIDSLRMLSHCSVLTLMLYVFSWLENIFSLGKYKWAHMVSRWPIVFYLVSYLIPDRITGVFASNLDFSYGLVSLFLFTTLLCFLVSYFLDIVMLRLKVNIKFEKVK